MSALSDLITAQSGLLVYWPLADTGGSSGFVGGPTASFGGSPTANPGGIPPLALGGSVLLDGAEGTINDYTAQSGGSALTNGATGSLETWYYPVGLPDATSDRTFVLAGSFANSTTSNGPNIYLESTGDAMVFKGYLWGNRPVGGPSSFAIFPNVGPVLGQWNHVVMTWGGTVVKFYLNGALVKSADISGFGTFTDPGGFTGPNFNLAGGPTYTGSSGGRMGAPGAYSNVAGYSAILSADDVAAHYAAGLGPSGPAARVTRFALEVLNGGGPSSARVTGLAVEVLRSIRVIVRAAKSATTELWAGDAGSETRDAAASATTSARVGLACSEALLPIVHAATAFRVGSAGSEVALRIQHVTTGLWLALPVDTRRIYAFDVTTALDVGSGARQRTYDSLGVPLTPDNNVLLDAATGLLVGDAGAAIPNVLYFVSAATAVNLGLAIASPNSLPVAATTGLALRSRGLSTVVEIVHFVAAETGLRLGDRGVAIVASPVALDATTGLSFAHAAAPDLDHTYVVRAATSLRLGSVGAEVRDASPSAATGLWAGQATARGREIHVSAVTGLVAGLGDQAGGLRVADGTPVGLLLGLDASLAVAGTEADTGLSFGHLATAESWLPWRLSELTLPPGGQLPHS